MNPCKRVEITTTKKTTLKSCSLPSIPAITGSVASQIGTGLLKLIPGVNIWVALLIQPPIVAAVAYSAGSAFKEYYRISITEGRDLTPEQVQRLATSALRGKLDL